MRAEDEVEFRQYVDASMSRHQRSALILSGNAHDAQDLVQHALIQLFLRWQKVNRRGNPDAYVRKIMHNKYIDSYRSAYNRHEERRADLPETPSDATLIGQLIADREQMKTVLAELSPFRRAVIVLRWYEDLSVEETARVLDCSTSRIKRNTTQGLLEMRNALTRAELEHG